MFKTKKLHVGIIMDGNRRWSIKNNIDIFKGYIQGVKNVKKICIKAMKLKISHLSLYAFSKNNFRRSKGEVDYLMQLLRDSINESLKYFQAKEIKFKVIGEISKLDKKLQDAISNATKMTQSNKKLTLYVAINYSGKRDIINACNRYINMARNQVDSIHQDLTEEKFSQLLYAKDMPNADIIIRTGKRSSLSDFLLWDVAYAEFYFMKKMWPDFKGYDLAKIVDNFYTLRRNFGR